MLRDFFLGFIKIHIMHHAAQEPIYGAAMRQELARHGYSLSPGTLYPILHRMAQDGYLVVQERVVRGKVRKYYTITELGRQALAEAQAKVGELVDEVIEGRGAASLADLNDLDDDLDNDPDDPDQDAGEASSLPKGDN